MGLTKKLKQFQFNPVTQALLLTIGGGVFGLVQQGTETASMLVNDVGLNRAFYQPPGINSFCLAGVGACMVRKGREEQMDGVGSESTKKAPRTHQFLSACHLIFSHSPQLFLGVE